MQIYNQYLAIIVSLIILLGNYSLGKYVWRLLMEDYSVGHGTNQFHYVIMGNVVLNIIVQYLVLIGWGNTVAINITGGILILMGLFECYVKRNKIRISVIEAKIILLKSGSEKKIVLLLLIGYFLIALAPITNADSLDYHLGVPMQILRDGFFNWQPTWFHQGLSGIGENSILLSIVMGAEQFSTLLQTVSIAAIVVLFYNIKNIVTEEEKKNRIVYVLLFVSTPVLLFLGSSPKPQLIGIYISSYIFVNVLDQKIRLNYKSVFVLGVLLFYNIALKLNFVLSGVAIFLIILHEYKNKLNFREIKIRYGILCVLAAACLVLGPILYYKSKIFGFNISSYIYPIPSSYPGHHQFVEYLRNYDDVKLLFPLSLFVPSSLGVYSMILGGNLIIAFILLFTNSLYIKHILYVLLLCILSGILGQRTSRFYLEPYIWLLLLLNYHSIKYYEGKYLKIISYILTIFQLLIVTFSVCTITIGVFNSESREMVLSKKANGYELAKWVNSLISKNSKILIDHRSTVLFDMKVYSSDWVHYIGSDDEESKFYIEYLKKESVQYVLLVGDEARESKLYRFCDKLVYGPFVGLSATRNPLNSGKKFNAWIYSIKL